MGFGPLISAFFIVLNLLRPFLTARGICRVFLPNGQLDLPPLIERFSAPRFSELAVVHEVEGLVIDQGKCSEGVAWRHL